MCLEKQVKTQQQQQQQIKHKNVAKAGNRTRNLLQRSLMHNLWTTESTKVSISTKWVET